MPTRVSSLFARASIDQPKELPRCRQLGLLLLVSSLASVSHAGMEEAKRWIDTEFSQSTLSRAEQLQEMSWFVDAAMSFRGMTIRVVSERIDTHWYEANVLAKAFEDITGVKVVHEITAEDDVVKKLTAQIETDTSIYDAYISDSDLIGTHFRSGHVVALDRFMVGEGRDVTLPSLDLGDFIGLSFTTGPDGSLYQLPDQQFANLYWYRQDWFERDDLRGQFQQRYGYPLGVPVNWSAYEDIAEFFSEHVREIDGQRVYGHMDYGLVEPSLGWRFSDAWLSMAGVGDPGVPNGKPVDEWGIRADGCRPVGASVARGGALNSPAAAYATRKYVEWLNKYAPPEAKQMNFSQAGSVPGQGQVAQQIFWYTAFTSALVDPALPVTNDDGTPKWRMAPSPRGPYWQPGMKLGYQDVGAWTLLKNTPSVRRQAAWLYAQFVVSKTVSLRKTLVGLTPIRHSDLESPQLSAVAHRYGGLVEFYRSNARNVWTPTGTNVPDYPRLSSLWWKHIGTAVTGSQTAQQAVDQLALAMDDELQRLANHQDGSCAPRVNPVSDSSRWLQYPGAPKPKLASEKPPGKTLRYEESLQLWN